MSEYENRIFNTLTASEEKFKSALEIGKHVNRIKRQLITQFWKSVEKELKVLILENDSDFDIILDFDIFHKNSKCFLYIENNKNARILYEHLADDQSMGLWIENQKFDMSKINNYIVTHGHEITNVTNHAWWVSYKNVDENFNNIDCLLMILPNTSIEYAKVKARDLFDFAVENKEHLKYVINYCLK